MQYTMMLLISRQLYMRPARVDWNWRCQLPTWYGNLAAQIHKTEIASQTFGVVVTTRGWLHWCADMLYKHKKNCMCSVLETVLTASDNLCSRLKPSNPCFI
jgi:hypothetical protein